MNQTNSEEINSKQENTPILDEKIMTLIDKEKLSSKILSVIGMCIGLLVFFASILTIFFLITGSIYVRSVLILLLVYQFLFAKKSENYRRFLKYMRPWEIFNSYTVHTEEDLAPKNSLFCFHPHGILSFGPSMSGSKNEILYNSAFCGSRAMLNMPLSGIVARWMGVNGVNNKNFKDLMNQSRNIIFVPGGFEEATLTRHGEERIFINSRKGFIKYALEYGYKVHPCYTFNENKIFNTFNYFESFRLFLNKLKIPGTIFYSKYLIFPNTDIDLFTVLGKGIQFPQINKPSIEEIDKYHQIYLTELQNLFKRYQFYFKAKDLEIL
jgi:hypothetical protein